MSTPNTPASLLTPVGTPQAPAPPPVPASPVPTPEQLQQPSQPQQSQPDAAKGLVGRAFGKVLSGLSGEQNTYSIDPETGQTVVGSEKTPPGQWARGVLAAGLLGMQGVGPKNGDNTFTQGLLSGLSGGMKAGTEQKQQLDEQRRQQAQLDYANELKAKESKRQDKELQMKQTLNDAMVANYNADKLMKDFQLIQAHNTNQQTAVQSMMERDAPLAEMYKEADVAPIATGVTAADFQKLLADNSNDISAHKVIPVITGKQANVHPDGSITWEPVGALYPVATKFTPNVLQQLKDAGVKPDDPLYKEVAQDVKNGTPVDPRKMISVQSELAKKFNYKEQNARIATQQAEAARAYAEEHTAYIQGRLAQLNLQDAENMREGKMLYGAIGDPEGLRLGSGKKAQVIKITPNGSGGYDFSHLTAQQKSNLRDYIYALQEGAQTDLDKLVTAQKNDPENPMLKQKVNDLAGVLSTYSNELNGLTGARNFPGATSAPNGQVKAISNLAQYHAGLLHGVNSQVFSKLLNLQLPEDEALNQLNQLSDLSPDDKLAISKQIQDFYTESEPYRKQAEEAAKAANQKVTQASEAAFKREHPYLSDVVQSEIHRSDYPSQF